jgi:hypothetical protein
MASDSLTFASFEKFKSEVALRTKKALMEQRDERAPLGGGEDRVGRSKSIERSRSGARSKSTDRQRSARGEGDGDHVPIHERIPERMKHTPKALSTQKSSEAPSKVPSDRVSRRLLQLAATEKQRTVTLWANTGNYSIPGVRCLLPETLEQLLDLAAAKVNLSSAARLIFRLPSGQQVSNMAQIRDEDCLVVSSKDAFRPPSHKKEKRPKSAIPVRETVATKRRYALHHNRQAPGTPFLDGELKTLLGDTSRLLRRFRLSYGGVQAVLDLDARQPRTLEDVRLLCGLGAVSLRNQALTSLKGMPVVDDMVELYLQNNFLTDLHFLLPQPKLRELRVELNCLTSLKGFTHQPRLEQVWLEGNPIAEHPHYRLMILIVHELGVGGHSGGGGIQRIDGVLVEKEERLLATALAPYVAEAIRSGWVLGTAPNPNADLDMTLAEYQVWPSRWTGVWLRVRG